MGGIYSITLAVAVGACCGDLNFDKIGILQTINVCIFDISLPRFLELYILFKEATCPRERADMLPKLRDEWVFHCYGSG